jgi:hypothetical protein
MSPHRKFVCYLCEKSFGGRKLGSSVGSGKFINNICKKCTKENYVWDHDLRPNYRAIEKQLKESQV